MSAVFLAVLAVPALAQTIYPAEGGTWNCGYTNPGNGYYMGYSYYYHASRTHRSSVAVNGNVYRSAITASGYTSCVNGPSVQNYTGIACYYSTL